MAATCFSPIRGLAMRTTRVNNCGCAVEGANNMAVSCGFVSIGLSAQIDEGTDILVRTAAGEICINEPACRVLTRYDITIEFCQVDPELFEIMASVRLLTDYKGDTVGHTVGENIQCQGGFAMEVWSGLAGADCDAGSAGSWYYWLLPWVTSGVIGGDITIEDGPATFTFTGRTKTNGCWGIGPYDVVAQVGSTVEDLIPGPLLSPGVLDDEHLYARTVELAPPACLCGAQDLVIPNVPVPVTIGLTEAAAITALTTVGLGYIVVEECDAADAGDVFLSDPVAATSVNHGTIVTIHVSTGDCP